MAQLLTHGAEGAPVEDVVPATKASGGLAASVLPLVLAGTLTGVLSSLLAAGAWRRAGLVVAGAVLTGLAATLIVQSWLGVVGGDWWANAAALSLTVLAIASIVSGLEALLGKAGIALGALTMIFVGNPLSGVASSPEMLPSGAGTLGQLLPPGAGGNLVRSTGFFDGAAAGGHIAVLSAWALAGLALLGLAALRNRPLKRGGPHQGGPRPSEDQACVAGGRSKKLKVSALRLPSLSDPEKASEPDRRTRSAGRQSAPVRRAEPSARCRV